MLTSRKPSLAFPAQRGKSPGLITLTNSILYFTPLTSSKPELGIRLDEILGVKKSGIAKGLKIRRVETGPNGIQQECEERFRRATAAAETPR